MIQHILKQIWAQRKYNAWIYVELVIIFVLMWVMTDYAFVLLHNKSIQQGFDANDTYMVTYGKYGNTTSRYYAAEDDSLKNLENLQLFTKKIKEYKHVAIADLSSQLWGSLPYSGDFNQTTILTDTDTTEVFAEVKNVRSGDFFRIFRYTSVKDNSWEGLASIDIYQNNPIFITRMVERALFRRESAIGKTIQADIGEGVKSYVVADVLNDQKRFDYALPQGAVFGASPNVTADNLGAFAVCLRTKPGISEQQFISDFRKDMTKQLRIGNFYLKDIQSFQSLKEDIDYVFGMTNEVRLRVALMLFFVLNISLGIIGTFWFRNQTRRSEIGLRMAVGSSRTMLQMQFIVEALLLLTIAVIPAIAINLLIVGADLIKLRMDVMIEYRTVKDSLYIIQNAPLRFLITNLITYVFLALIVGLSAWIPAHRASTIHPVDALRDE